MEPFSEEITVKINQDSHTVSIQADETLLTVLRRLGFYSVKTGCDDGTCGVCTVLLNGKPTFSCKTKAKEIDGAEIITLEGLGNADRLHQIQQAFIDSGAIQCGYCTPAQILATKALLDKNPDPTENEIRKALNPILCRCTGYVRGIDAVKRAAALMRGEEVESYRHIQLPLPADTHQLQLPDAYYRRDGERDPLKPLVLTPEGMSKTNVVGRPEIKVDAKKLALGKPVFTDDFRMDGMLFGVLLTSPHAHAKIRNINVEKARNFPGVQAVLTYKDIPRVKYASGGQSYPQPPPFDQVSLDNKVRHVGDRVAILAAESLQIAKEALDLIEVDYEVLPAVVDMESAMKPGVTVIHDEEDTEGIYDRDRNIVVHIEAEVGDTEVAFSEADHVFEGEYRTPMQQQAHLEPHVTITYFDEDNRLVIRTSTQVPFHIRRMVAPLINMPIKNIRVIKPRIGGGFGNKQELILEDLCAHLTLKTGRPVRMEYSREQEFISSRRRHSNILHYKIGVKGDKVTAADLYLIGETGAYGAHALTVQMVGGFKGLTLYNAPNAKFISDVVYTNTVPAGAFRGYGAMQCQYGIEVLMAEIAAKLGLDVVEFKRKNWLKVGEPMHLSKQLGEGREGVDQSLQTSGLDQCVDIGIKATDFYTKKEQYQGQQGRFRRGIGMAVVMHGSGIANLDMGAATLKMNDDGSFNLLIGATDLGTGSDTILAQMAAEILGITIEDIIVYSSDTDFTPFDVGAYASSTTYISGGAVRKAALKIKKQILEHAALMLGLSNTQGMRLENGMVFSDNGSSVTIEEVALNSLHQLNQHQIMATAKKSTHFGIEYQPSYNR